MSWRMYLQRAPTFESNAREHFVWRIGSRMMPLFSLVICLSSSLLCNATLPTRPLWHRRWVDGTVPTSQNHRVHSPLRVMLFPPIPSLSNSSPFFSFHPSFCRSTLDPCALFDDWVLEMISVFTSAFTSVQRATVTFYSVFLSLLFSSDVPFISRYSKITSALLCPLWYSTSRSTQACSLGPNKLFSLLFCFLFLHSENLSMKRFATGGHCNANQVDLHII